MHRYPDFTINGHRELLHFKRDEDRAHYLEELCLAGVPARTGGRTSTGAAEVTTV